MPLVMEESEAKTAELLADALTEEGWSDTDPFTANEMAESRSAEKALRMYEALAPVFAANIAGAPRAVDLAATAAGEIADGYAMRSATWPQANPRHSLLPNRTVVEHFVHTNGIDSWASGLGYPVAFRTPPPASSPVSSPVQSAAQAASDHAARIAHDFAKVAGVYEKFLGVRDKRGSGPLPNVEPLRAIIPTQIASAREWGAWVRDSLDEGWLPVANAMLAIARGSFVIAWESVPKPNFFPTKEHLQAILRVNQAARLLSAHASLPDWVSTE